MLAFMVGFLMTTGGSNDFPLTDSADRRTLQTPSGKSFPILGRTAWAVMSLSSADQDIFLDDTVARGFNAIECGLIWHDSRSNHPPFDGAGNAPFLKTNAGSAWYGALSYGNISQEAPDFSTPKPAYWDNALDFISRCRQRGILVLGFPAYVGYSGGDQGWMQEILANGPDRMRAYGAWLGRRCQHVTNLVWMAGGDMGHYTDAQQAALNSLYEGIDSANGASKHWSAEWDSGMIGTDQEVYGTRMTLNSVYTWVGSPAALGLRAYHHSPKRPAFLLEEPYDEEGPDGNSVNPNATQPVRRFEWWGWLTSIGGYIAGNGYIWPFQPGVWQAHLDTPGSRDLKVLNHFVRSIEWSRLVPNESLCKNHGPSDQEVFIPVAASPEGDLLVAYFPPARSGKANVAFDSLPGIHRARWMDPTTGAFRPASGFVAGQSSELTPPGANASGDADWVLVADGG